MSSINNLPCRERIVLLPRQEIPSNRVWPPGLPNPNRIARGKFALVRSAPAEAADSIAASLSILHSRGLRLMRYFSPGLNAAPRPAKTSCRSSGASALMMTAN